MPASKVICTNCGIRGHVFKSCNQPVTSCGVICIRRAGERPAEFLVVQRKDSFAFVDFMRGKYSLSDLDYMRTLFDGMTVSERSGVRCLEFSELWSGLWRGFSKSKNKSEYDTARGKFNSLREGVHVNGRLCDVEWLLSCTTGRESPEWGFPKGRRASSGESDADCAVRELREETGVCTDNLAFDGRVYQETFTGTNGIQYRNVYHVAYLIDFTVPVRNCDKEIKQVRWVGEAALVALVRDSPSRAAIVQDVMSREKN